MTLHSVEELKTIRGKRVLVRVDFNVPVDAGQVADDTRIKAAVPTIEYLQKKGAKVILMCHFGRPKGKGPGGRDRVLGSVVERLEELLKKKVQNIDKWDFEDIGKEVKRLKAGDILILPNLRLHSGEEKNNAVFSKQLAGLSDLYVNEAFSASHRKHASLVGVPKFLPAYAGLQLMKEIQTLDRVLHEPARPLIVLMGGGKITDKIAMIKAMIKRATVVLIGGALMNHFFKAAGYGVGASRIESEGVATAKQLMKNKKIVLPKDVVVGTPDGKKAWVVEVPGVASESPASRVRGTTPLCEKPYSILDIGPKTILSFSHFIKTARMLIWNGPMGIYEVKPFSHGTLALGRLFAARSKGKAFGVIGGGETIDAMRKTGMGEYVDFISTGGGAMLEYLGGKKLPGIEALKK